MGDAKIPLLESIAAGTVMQSQPLLGHIRVVRELPIVLLGRNLDDPEPISRQARNDNLTSYRSRLTVWF